MRPLRYNLTPQQEAATAMLGGKIPTPDPYISQQFASVNRAFGSGDVDMAAKGLTGTAPWPGASKSKKNDLYDKDAVRDALTAPRTEKDVRPQDPRQLHATQPGITRGGVEYYMGDEYANTGRTFADQNNVGNTRPVVYHKSDGRSLLLSGHHRATAALLQGEQFNAHHIFGD
jgi:hypothetical protein